MNTPLPTTWTDLSALVYVGGGVALAVGTIAVVQSQVGDLRARVTHLEANSVTKEVLTAHLTRLEQLLTGAVQQLDKLETRLDTLLLRKE